METLNFQSVITNGKLPDAVSKQIAGVLRSLEGKRVTIEIKVQKRRRSLNQNAFYHGCIIPPILAMMREMGNNLDPDDVHSFLKQEVGKLNQVVVLPDGEVKTVTGSSAKLTTMEFEVYLTKIRAWASEWGIMLPMPNEER